MKKMIELTTKPCSVFKMNKIITESWNPKRLREFLRPARTLFGYNDGAVTISHRLPMHLISSFSTSSQHFYHSTSVQNHTSQNCKSLFLFKNWIQPLFFPIISFYCINAHLNRIAVASTWPGVAAASIGVMPSPSLRKQSAPRFKSSSTSEAMPRSAAT